MKPTISIAVAVYFTLACASCMSSNEETPFFSNFSIRQLVETGKSSAQFACDTTGRGGNGGGGADFNRVWGSGSGGRRFNSHKSDSFTCQLKPDQSFDETNLFSALKLDVQRALNDNGAQITDSGSPGSAAFYFAYEIKNVRGRVQIAGQRIGTDHYEVHASLDETNN